ncbi:hypothetical protein ACIPMW_15860 [Streptomyces sp. NPDC086669]|uniref:hypothetical protein n=1 Tax=Streptomyces sp. NPDC086669 TaxID=3365753 RepID=UPI0038229341
MSQRTYTEWRAFFLANPEAAAAPLWTMPTAEQRNAAVAVRTNRAYREQPQHMTEEWVEPLSMSRVVELTNPYAE